MSFTKPMKTSVHATTEQAIRSAKLPRYVVDRRILIDLDSTGEEAVWIWLVIPDEKNPTVKEMQRIFASIDAALKAAGVSMWAFVRYRGVREQRSLDRSKSRA